MTEGASRRKLSWGSTFGRARRPRPGPDRSRGQIGVPIRRGYRRRPAGSPRPGRRSPGWNDFVPSVCGRSSPPRPIDSLHGLEHQRGTPGRAVGQRPPCRRARADREQQLARTIAVVECAASRPVRRILFGPRSAVTIHLGRRSPDGSSGLPGVIGRAVLPLLGLAPGGACRATRVTPGAGALLPHRFTLTCAPVARRHRRSALCCAVLRVAPTGGYPAPCPVESGRSSNQSRWSAATRPTRCADPV